MIKTSIKRGNTRIFLQLIYFIWSPRFRPLFCLKSGQIQKQCQKKKERILPKKNIEVFIVSSFPDRNKKTKEKEKSQTTMSFYGKGYRRTREKENALPFPLKGAEIQDKKKRKLEQKRRKRSTRSFYIWEKRVSCFLLLTALTRKHSFQEEEIIAT